MGARNHPARGPHPRLVYAIATATSIPAVFLAGLRSERALALLVIPAPLYVLLGIDWLRSREAWMRFVQIRTAARWYDVLLLGGYIWPRSGEYFAPERIFAVGLSIVFGCGLAAIGLFELISLL